MPDRNPTEEQLRLEIQEAERRRLSRALHDEVGQLLTATKLTLQAAQRARSTRTACALLREGLGLLDQCIGQVRSLSLELRPSLLDDLGLPAALRWYLGKQAERAGFTVRFEGPLSDARLPQDVETACYRVIQEAVTNVARHARARSVTVTLSIADGGLEAVVRDDGVGFNVRDARARASAGASLGLLAMEERVSLLGGQIQLDSAPGQGTRLWTRIPLRLEQPPTRKAGVA